MSADPAANFLVPAGQEISGVFWGSGVAMIRDDFPIAIGFGQFTNDSTANNALKINKSDPVVNDYNSFSIELPETSYVNEI